MKNGKKRKWRRLTWSWGVFRREEFRLYCPLVEDWTEVRGSRATWALMPSSGYVRLLITFEKTQVVQKHLYSRSPGRTDEHTALISSRESSGQNQCGESTITSPLPHTCNLQLCFPICGGVSRLAVVITYLSLCLLICGCDSHFRATEQNTPALIHVI